MSDSTRRGFVKSSAAAAAGATVVGALIADDPGAVTIIANYLPLQAPFGYQTAPLGAL